VADIPLVPEGDIFHRRDGISADHPSQSAEPLAGDRIPFMGHRRAPLLPGTKIFLHLEDLGPLEVTELGRPSVNARCDQCQRHHKLRVTVALDDLRREGRRDEPEFFADVGLHAGVEVGMRANGAADLADADALAGLLEPFERARELVIHEREFEAECDRLGMDPMAAADHRGELVFDSADGNRLAKGSEVGSQNVAGLQHLHGDGRVEQVRRCETLVDPPRGRSDVRGHILQERNDVVVGSFFDLPNGRDIKLSFRPDLKGILAGDRPDIGHRLAGKSLNLEPDF